MLSFIARALFLLLLVVIVILGVIAIQYPALWHKNWQAVDQQWQHLQGNFVEKSVTAPKPVQSIPVRAPVVVTPPPMPAAVPAAPKPQLNTRQLTLLMAARHAYWIGDYPVALADYRALVSAKPNLPALYGEYGNVLWHLGQGVSAANAYAHAARLLVQQGNYQQAANMIPMLSRLDPSAAERVQMLLAQ